MPSSLRPQRRNPATTWWTPRLPANPNSKHSPSVKNLLLNPTSNLVRSRPALESRPVVVAAAVGVAVAVVDAVANKPSRRLSRLALRKA